jgi:hypothetical protein
MRFPNDVILVCIRWYAACPLSYRHPEEMMQDRSIVRPSDNQSPGHPVLAVAGKGLLSSQTSCRLQLAYGRGVNAIGELEGSGIGRKLAA